jgi:predicted nuclease of predicted toxin-antitoxin system
LARLYSNENFPLRTVHELRALGHDVTTIQESHMAGQGVPDPTVLELATSEDRAVVTLNRSHRTEPRTAHAGIIVCTVDPDFHRLARRIHNAIQLLPDLREQLIRVNRPDV